MSTPFKKCPHCGAHLDAGEICDCQREAAISPRPTPGPMLGYRGTAETARLHPYAEKKKAADA